MRHGSKTARAKPGRHNAKGVLAEPERAELQRQGAKAAARGEAAASNPLEEPLNQPPATGESADTWQQRHDAWRQGHEAQACSTGTNDPPSLPKGADDEQH